MENTTRDRIINAAFKLFLEVGYEATNIRDICNEVGIKSSTMYFYFKSKQELFFNIYDETTKDFIRHIKESDDIKRDIPLEEKLFLLLKRKIDYYALDISRRKFILRYHLFPPEEISNELRDKYRNFTIEENETVLKIIENSNDKTLFEEGSISGYLLEYRRLESYLAYEMVLSGIKVNDKEIRKIWTAFWNKAVE